MCVHTWATCCMPGTQLSGEPPSTAARAALPPRCHPAASHRLSLGRLGCPGFRGGTTAPHSPCAALVARVSLSELLVYQHPSEQLRGGVCQAMLRCRYDMTRANLVDPELEKYVQRGLSLPDVVLVSCQALCCCTPACLSLAAAAPHNGRAPHSTVLHCWVCSCGQL